MTLEVLASEKCTALGWGGSGAEDKKEKGEPRQLDIPNQDELSWLF